MITINATGEGLTDPPGVDGAIASATPPVPTQSVAVIVGGNTVPITYAGGIPGLSAGFFQIVAQLPNDATAGDAVPILLSIGDVTSPAGVTMSVQ